jgi:hypothetical protein
MITVDGAADERLEPVLARGAAVAPPDPGREAARGARQLAAAVALGLALWLAGTVALCCLAL